jgi:OPA family glycerol-3-phosphate transporter-like MFS transporter
MTAAAVIDERFRLRRIQNWVFLGLMYAMFYMARYNLSVADPYLLQAFGWTKEDLGILKSAGLITYGISVFLNGPIADRIGGKRALLIGAVGSAASNVTFALLGAKLATGGGGRGAAVTLAAVSAVNYYFQSFGALSIVKVNAAWFNVRERGSFAGIFGIMIQLGRLLPFAVGAQLLAHLPWPSVFLVPAGALLLMFALDFFLIEDSPAAAGLGEYDTGDESPEEAAKAVSLVSVLARFFTQPVAWVIAGASFCTGIVRQGILDQWSVLYFKEVHGLLPNAAIVQLLQAWLIPVFSVVAGLAAGVVSDRIFGARRGPVIAIAFAGQLVALLLLGRAGSALGAALVLAGLQFFIQGGHSLIGGAASMDFGGRKAAATAAGLFDGMQYAAGAVVTYGMGKLLTRFGWSSWTYIVLPFVVIGMALAASLWNTLPKRGGLHGGAPPPPAKAPALGS